MRSLTIRVLFAFALAFLLGMPALAADVGTYVRSTGNYPDNPVSGKTWVFDSTDSTLKVYLDGSWVPAMLPRPKLSSASDPTVDDDIDEGWLVGAVWLNTTTDKIFVCTDNTDGAAVWKSAQGSLNSITIDVPDDVFDIDPSTITDEGTFDLTKHATAANLFAAGPSSGGATAWGFRAIVRGDLPSGTVFNDVTNSWTVGQLPNAASIVSWGSNSLPLLNVYIGSEGANKTASFNTSALTTNRSIVVLDGTNYLTLDATAPSNQFANGITAGILQFAQPAFSDLSGVGSAAQGCSGQTTLQASIDAFLNAMAGASLATGDTPYYDAGDGHWHRRAVAGAPDGYIYTIVSGVPQWVAAGAASISAGTNVSVSGTTISAMAATASVSGNTTLTVNSDTNQLITTGSSTITMTLPAVSNTGKEFRFSKVDSGTGSLVIAPASGEAIGPMANSASFTLFGYGSQPNETFSLRSDGSKWRISSSHLSGLGGSATGSATGCPTSGTIRGGCWHFGNWVQTGPLILDHARIHIFGNATIAYLVTVTPENAGGLGWPSAGSQAGSGSGLGGGSGATMSGLGGGGAGHQTAGGHGGSNLAGGWVVGGGIYSLDTLLAGSGGGGGAYGTDAGGGGGCAGSDGGPGGGGALLEAHGNIIVGGNILALGGPGLTATAPNGAAGAGGSGGGLNLGAGGSITFASSTKKTCAMSGTVTAGNILTLTFTTGVSAAPSYTVTAGDAGVPTSSGYAFEAAGLAAAINANSTLTNAGVCASASGSTVSICYPAALGTVNIAFSQSGSGAVGTVNTGSGTYTCDVSGGRGGHGGSTSRGGAGAGGGTGVLYLSGNYVDTRTNSPGFNFNGGLAGMGNSAQPATAGTSLSNADTSCIVQVPASSWLNSTSGSPQNGTTGYAQIRGEPRLGN